jgi:hypothetical protein
MTSFLEVLINRLYEDVGGPPIETKKKTDDPGEIPAVLIRHGRHAFPPNSDSDDE